MNSIWGLLLLIVGLIIITGATGDLFRAYPAAIFILWIAIPTFATIVRYSKYKNSLSIRFSKWIRIISVFLAIECSFCIFAHFDQIRDKIGHENIKGYHSEYYPDVDNYARPIQGVNVYTSHWFDKFILWLFELLYVILCFAIPIVTWKQCSVIYDKAQDRVETKT